MHEDAITLIWDDFQFHVTRNKQQDYVLDFQTNLTEVVVVPWTVCCKNSMIGNQSKSKQKQRNIAYECKIV